MRRRLVLLDINSIVAWEDGLFLSGGRLCKICAHCWLYLRFRPARLLGLGIGALKIHGTYHDINGDSVVTEVNVTAFLLRKSMLAAYVTNWPWP